MDLRRSLFFVFLTVLVTIPLFGGAHSGATGVVKERMEQMKAMGASMKTLAKMVNGQVPYEAGEVAKLANVFAINSGAAMTKLFPEGSIMPPSEAKATIWQKWDKFETLAKDLQVQAEALSITVNTTQEDLQTVLRANFMQLSSVCKNCHTEFREEKSQ